MYGLAHTGVSVVVYGAASVAALGAGAWAKFRAHRMRNRNNGS